MINHARRNPAIPGPHKPAASAAEYVGGPDPFFPAITPNPMKAYCAGGPSWGGWSPCRGPVRRCGDSGRHPSFGPSPRRTAQASTGRARGGAAVRLETSLGPFRPDRQLPEALPRCANHRPKQTLPPVLRAFSTAPRFRLARLRKRARKAPRRKATSAMGRWPSGRRRTPAKGVYR